MGVTNSAPEFYFMRMPLKTFHVWKWNMHFVSFYRPRIFFPFVLPVILKVHKQPRTKKLMHWKNVIVQTLRKTKSLTWENKEDKINIFFKRSCEQLRKEYLNLAYENVLDYVKKLIIRLTRASLICINIYLHSNP